MTRVALLKCEDYDSLLIREKMVEALNLIGLGPGIFAGKEGGHQTESAERYSAGKKRGDPS